MNKKGLKANSIIVRLMLAMLVVLLIQSSMLAGSIWHGGTIREINNTSVDLSGKQCSTGKIILKMK